MPENLRCGRVLGPRHLLRPRCSGCRRKRQTMPAGSESRRKLTAAGSIALTAAAGSASRRRAAECKAQHKNLMHLMPFLVGKQSPFAEKDPTKIRDVDAARNAVR